MHMWNQHHAMPCAIECWVSILRLCENGTGVEKKTTLRLYRLHRVINKMWHSKSSTNNKKWIFVSFRTHHPGCITETKTYSHTPFQTRTMKTKFTAFVFKNIELNNKKHCPHEMLAPLGRNCDNLVFSVVCCWEWKQKENGTSMHAVD